MLTNNERKQNQLELVYIENLVPENHILRKIDKFIDFSFIRDLTKDLYCPDNGRPSVDPVVLFKMLFIGYLFGIRSFLVYSSAAADERPCVHPGRPMSL
ncbi:hypothetical protein ADU74_11265 [Clostridium botulinum]|uniref:Transposase InsH N-terminal domain-containing protein n=1 Tax=Clostridium botulinum TaxID=1491 RepID=A0A9Q1UWS1_CLOBO|nr:hypothetical protein ADU74_11265 [Clostridium botulinum]